LPSQKTLTPNPTLAPTLTARPVGDEQPLALLRVRVRVRLDASCR
jgi:hypothetical protein